MPIDLFPITEYWWLYAAFTAFVMLLLALDLGVFHRKAHEVSSAKPPPGAPSGLRSRSVLPL